MRVASRVAGRLKTSDLKKYRNIRKILRLIGLHNQSLLKEYYLKLAFQKYAKADVKVFLAFNNFA